MKKTLLTIFAVVAMLTVVAGQAMATSYFNEGDLIRVIYNQGGTTEEITDLGSGLAATTAGSLGDTVLSSNSMALSDLGSTASNWSSVYVAYFVLGTPGGSGVNPLWVTGAAGGQTGTKALYNAALSALETVLPGNSASGVAENIISQTSLYSYVADINGTNPSAPGTMTGFIKSGNMEQSLAAFNSGAGSVAQELYYYGTPSTGVNQAGLDVETISTIFDGTTVTTEINPTTTPLPAAIYLFGTGLLGLFGIRRKETEV